MTRSLAEDLRVLAHSGRGADDAHPGAMIAEGAGHLVRQIRRRRAARQTGMGAIGVSAVAAVALGGTQGPGWLAHPWGASPDESVTPTVEPTEGPTATPTPSPTDQPPHPTAETTAETTAEPGESTAPPAPGALSAGLQLVADVYSLDLSCGAPLTYEVIEAAGGRGADHLTPSIAVDPTRADQPLAVTNGIPDDGAIMDGYARTTPVVVVARDGMVVGWGGGDVVRPERDNVVMTYEIELERLHQCADPAMAADGLGLYTLWVMASESGFGLPEDVEGLSFAAGLKLDLATGAWGYDVGTS